MNVNRNIVISHEDYSSFSIYSLQFALIRRLFCYFMLQNLESYTGYNEDLVDIISFSTNSFYDGYDFE